MTQDLNKIKKSHKPFGKTETCAKFQQQKKIKFLVVGACQSFKFFGQITWFLGNKRVLSKFKCWILHHSISIIKVQN